MAARRSKNLITMLYLAIPSVALFVIMFLLTTHSSKVAFDNFMKVNFGYTNRWSKTFGPEWLIDISRDISALGGHIDFILIVGFVSFFLFFLREDKRLTEFLVTVIGVIVLLFTLKFTLNSNSPNNLFGVFFSNDLGFPSGHALMSLVLYSALAKYSGRKLIYTSARYVVYIFAVVVIFLIGVSRLFTSHTLTEVIAGWSAGLFWISIVNYFFRK